MKTITRKLGKHMTTIWQRLQTRRLKMGTNQEGTGGRTQRL